MAEGSTSLCKKDESPCALANRVTHVHEESIGHALLLSSFATVECEALFLGDTLNSGLGNPLIIHGNFTYTCLNGCSATEENSPAEIKVLRLGSELADVTGEGLVHVICGLNCKYNGVGLKAHALEALTASNEVGEAETNEGLVNKESGFFCPSTSYLDITTEPLEAIYINEPAEPTSLCKADEEPCKTANKITHVHEESIGHALLLSSFATVECEALFLGDTLNSGLGNPLIIHGTFSYTCLNGCSATEESSPAEIKVLRLGSELADVTGEGLVHVICGLNCKYNGVGLKAHALGALTASNEVGEVEINEGLVNKESGFFCPSTSYLDITTEPLEATYISS